MDSDDTNSSGQESLPFSAGTRLRAAREAAGLSRSDIASQTKIAERHLLAIEEDRFGDLAARTYAVGFARAYARALGLDEAEIAAAVRKQIDAEENHHVQTAPSFEPGDPARVPAVRLAWLAAAGVVLVVALLLMFWGSFLSPEGELPDLLAEQTAAPATGVAAPAAPPPAPTSGPVVLTATADDVWLRVTDADGKQLLEKELARGESWTVPEGTQGAQLRTGRPDALQLTVGGRPVPRLSTRAETVSGVSLAAGDLLARGAGSPTAAVSTSVPAADRQAATRSVSQPAPRPRVSATPTASQTRTPSTTLPAPTPSVRPASQPTASPTPRRTTASSPAPTATGTPPAAAPTVQPSPTPTGSTPGARASSAPAEPATTTPQASRTPAAVSTDSE